MVAKSIEEVAKAKKALAERCKWARKRLRLTLGEVAELAGVTYSVIANTETERNETIRKITEVARALQVNPHWLATGEGAHDDPVEQEALPTADLFAEFPQDEVDMAMGWLSLWRDADSLARGLIESAFAVAGRKEQPALRRA